jgi:hypothetical protein
VTLPTVCGHCGQPVTPTVSLPPIKQRILDAVRRHPGIDAESLRSIVWDGADGGPEDRKVLHVHVHQLNRLLMPFGLRVRGSRFYSYRVQAVEKGR